MRAKVAIAVVLVAVTAYAVADSVDVVPGVLTFAAPSRPAPSPRPTLSDPARLAADPVLAPLSREALMPSPAGVARALRPLLGAPALGPQVTAYVADAETGDVLLDVGAERPMIPASNAKLLTGAAVLSTVGGQTRLVTRVVQGASPDEIVLVGGGDMLLGAGRSSSAVAGRAGLADLAASVAAKLSVARQRRIVVRFDDSLFSGPNVSPRWLPGDVSTGYTGRVAALGLATDRARPGHPSSVDPAMTAATAFAGDLRAAGVDVVGSPQRTAAPAHSAVLGQVQSAPVAEILELALLESDNALAEVLAHLTAHAMGRRTTFQDSAVAVLDEVQELGLDVGATRLVDGSGLGRGSRVPARVLGDVLLMAASPAHPRLRPLIEGLPVAGFTGTLADRFALAATRPAAGIVRAKTGTLTGAGALAGATVDRDGRLLVFVLMADRLPVGDTTAAQLAFDQLGAAMSACGCR